MRRASRHGQRRALAARQQIEAKATKESIRNVGWLKFQVEGEVEWLPFPGLRCHGVGVKRPPPEFPLVGRSEYTALLEKIVFEEDSSRGLIVTGPKGSGKSCLLRALAIELICRLSAHERVICIWHFDAGQDLQRQVQELLIFTYCDADQDIIDKILDLSSPEDLAQFLLERRAIGDYITLLCDGLEKLDALHRDRSKRTPEEDERRGTARNWMGAFERSCDFVVKALSPEAIDAVDIPYTMQRHELKDLFFTQAEYSSFLQETLLGMMLKEHPERQADVVLYADKHPMSLFLLDKACKEYVESITKSFFNKKRRFESMCMVDPETGTELHGKDWETELESPEKYLDEKRDWEMVLLNFKTAEAFEGIRDYIKNRYTGEIEKLRDPASVLKGYVRNGCFCTDYLYAVHVEAALERLKGGVYRSPQFKANLVHKLKKLNVIWPEVGWACEGFVAEAIQAMGLNFQGGLIEVFTLEALKGEPVEIRPNNWKPHQARYMLPGKYSFKYVDGVLAWVDEQEVLHILALQVTVSPETHRKTEYRFVRQEEMQRWYTGYCFVHYVYICPTPTKKAPVSHNAYEGKVAYMVHELELSQCFTNLGQDEINILKELGQLRKVEVERRKQERLGYQRGYQGSLKSLPEEKQKIFKKAKEQPGGARAWLENKWRTEPKYGIRDPSRKQYPNLYSLLQAMTV